MSYFQNLVFPTRELIAIIEFLHTPATCHASPRQTSKVAALERSNVIGLQTL